KSTRLVPSTRSPRICPPKHKCSCPGSRPHSRAAKASNSANCGRTRGRVKRGPDGGFAGALGWREAGRIACRPAARAAKELKESNGCKTGARPEQHRSASVVGRWLQACCKPVAGFFEA